jgi:hypothetical protein
MAVDWTWLVANSVCCRFSASIGIPDKENLIKEVAAWQIDRTKKHAKAD